MRGAVMPVHGWQHLAECLRWCLARGWRVTFQPGLSDGPIAAIVSRPQEDPVEGSGVSPEEALADALRAALEELKG